MGSGAGFLATEEEEKKGIVLSSAPNGNGGDGPTEHTLQTRWNRQGKQRHVNRKRGGDTMKWLLVCSAVLVMVAPAMAGEDPYIGIVGTDCVPDTTTCPGTPDPVTGNVQGQAKPWYFSPKYQQFMYNENDPTTFAIPVSFGPFPPKNQYTRGGDEGTEQYRSMTANKQVEVCYVEATDDGRIESTNPNAKTPAGNAGFYEWYINLPKKPTGEINIVIQCGVLKPNALAFYPYNAIELCAAETGERIGVGLCVRDEVGPGVSPVNQVALPRITAIAYPGAFNVPFTPFRLTAWRNPGSYTFTVDKTGAMVNTGNIQVLDGSTNARILLKACMDKTIVTKLPLTGQVNAAGDTEADLVAGDMIYVRMDVPRQNTVDIYCHAQSARIAGVGETWN
jgi:hypothetical protein